MKQLLLVVFGLVGVQAAFATPLCGTGSLASYIALGSGGCTIGADTITSFATLAPNYTPISTTLITVMPAGGTTNPELTFSFSQTANAPATLEAFFTYTISGPTFLTDVITVSNSSETGNGDVTDTQNYCVGGHFGMDGVDGCTGSTSGALAVVDGSGLQTDNANFPASTHSLNITDDFVVDSGGTDSASGGTFADQFTTTTATPEPGAFVLTGAGLALAALRRFRGIH